MKRKIYIGKKWNGKIYDILNKTAFDIKKGSGFIKEYDFDGRLTFEGELMNGVRSGKGKEYHYNGNLKFEGNYLLL